MLRQFIHLRWNNHRKIIGLSGGTYNPKNLSISTIIKFTLIRDIIAYSQLPQKNHQTKQKGEQK